MFKLMPASYYDMSGGVVWHHVLLQLIVQVRTRKTTLTLAVDTG